MAQTIHPMNYMKTTTSIIRLAALAAVAVIAGAYNAPAASVTMNLGTVIPGTGTFVAGDLSSAPYVVATFTDVSGGVQLVISCPGLGFAGSGNYEHIGTGSGHDGLLLNVTDTQVGKLTFAYQSMTVAPTTSNGMSLAGATIDHSFAVTQALNGYDAGAGQKFDINMPFAEHDISTEFGNGKSITYFITSSLGGGVSTADFSLKDSSGTYYAAAAIDDANKGLYVGSTGVTSSISSVPEAANTATLLGLAMLGLGGFKRKLCKS